MRKIQIKRNNHETQQQSCNSKFLTHANHETGCPHAGYTIPGHVSFKLDRNKYLSKPVRNTQNDIKPVRFGTNKQPLLSVMDYCH